MYVHAIVAGVELNVKRLTVMVFQQMMEGFALDTEHALELIIVHVTLDGQDRIVKYQFVMD
jgi:hypothetical protein